MITLMRATMDDAARLFEWRTDPATRGSSHSAGPVSFDHHRAWLERTLARPGVRLYVVIDPQREEWIGTCRLDREDRSAAISLTVSPHARGQGYAGQILSALQHEAIEWGVERLTATVKPSNVASLRAFAAAGFQQYHGSDAGESVEFELLVAERPRASRSEPT